MPRRAAKLGGIGLGTLLTPVAGAHDDHPGVTEVCARCVVEVADHNGGASAQFPLTLRRSTDKAAWPLWPRRADPPGMSYLAVGERARPASHNDGPPSVALLFSGGVFRGVFQIGVLNALNESRMRPDLYAGSSVGSIVAAMSAHLLTNPDESARHQRMARVAATFLALDRLVLTDRFADLVRRFTIRAAATDVSLRDVDDFLRRYDAQDQKSFSDTARRVLAGMERLFYVSPFEFCYGQATRPTRSRASRPGSTTM